MRIHFISIGGAAMHNLAIALHKNGHHVTGSDDEIYNPSRDRLASYGLLPNKMGWDNARITTDIEAIILGMHARQDNPELLKAQVLGLPIYSYPAFLYEHSKDKKRIVVAGSHGKTTTTSMIMHVLKYHQVNFDYLVGAQLEGFDTMVRLSDAPIIVIEGDEYLSSPIDRRPKILHYRPHTTVLTGIAWDHINVFPTFENYIHQFELYLNTIESGGELIYYEPDEEVSKLVNAQTNTTYIKTPYQAFDFDLKNGVTYLKNGLEEIKLQVFGQHNLANLKGAYHACQAAGISEEQFFEAIPSFAGASKRLQLLNETQTCVAYLDFAHAPSKLQATVQALKQQYPKRKLVACFELHTFSSLNKAFLHHYAATLDAADYAYVYFNEHTLEMKRLPPISKEEVKTGFANKKIKVFTSSSQLVNTLKKHRWNNKNLLMMSSGTFGGLDYKTLSKELLFLQSKEQMLKSK